MSSEAWTVERGSPHTVGINPYAGMATMGTSPIDLRRNSPPRAPADRLRQGPPPSLVSAKATISGPVPQHRESASRRRSAFRSHRGGCSPMPRRMSSGHRRVSIVSGSSQPAAASISILPGVSFVHGNGGLPPFEARVVAFNRDAKTGRAKYTVQVRFENQIWRVYKYYTDFYRLRNVLEHSVFCDAATGLPPKHPLRLKLRMKLSWSKRRSLRKEMRFIEWRMERLEHWINSVLERAGPSGVQDVKILNDFFEAFPVDEPYNQSHVKPVHANIDTSMYHALRSMAVPDRVYRSLWAAGYCFESLATLSSTQWLDLGVSPVLASSLFARFSKLQSGSDSRECYFRRSSLLLSTPCSPLVSPTPPVCLQADRSIQAPPAYTTSAQEAAPLPHKNKQVEENAAPPSAPQL